MTVLLWALADVALLTGLVLAWRRLGRINDQAGQSADRPVLLVGGGSAA